MTYGKFAAIGLAALGAAFASAAAASDGDKVQNWRGEDDAGERGFLTRVQEFVVNTHRRDAYRGVNFEVRWDGRVVPGVSSVSPLARMTDPVDYRDGADMANRMATPGLTRFAPITLRRGVTHDTAFEAWADKVWSIDGAGAVDLKNYRKDVVVNLLNLRGQVAKSYRLFSCWPVRYEAIGGLDAERSRMAEEVLTIQCDGWARDRDVVEPTE